ncbi:MAG: DUF5916 domain-containing protein [Desulfobacterales bacterium]|nr:DUF5916 domain-containing protein [Desulfobacterales bacterium]
MTLDLTANPDFSQIEADEPKIDYNVRYALRYNEKRPFFLEGMEIFNSPEIETVYTRQINDPIFGAKASGKSGRFTYGLLSAYDMHPVESLWDISGGEGLPDTKSFSNVFRTKADVGSGSYVGFTLTDKELGGGTWSRLGGLDGQLRFKDRVFFNFQALASSSSFEGDRTDLAPGLYGELYYTNKHFTLRRLLQGHPPGLPGLPGLRQPDRLPERRRLRLLPHLHRQEVPQPDPAPHSRPGSASATPTA